MTGENSNNQLEFNNDIRKYLDIARKWAKFLAIVAFVMLGLLVIYGFTFSTIMSALTGEAYFHGVPSIIIGIVYLIIAIVYFFPYLFLYRFSAFTKKGIRNSDQHSINSSFKNLKAYFAFYGVLTIIFLGLTVLVVLATLVFGIAFHTIIS